MEVKNEKDEMPALVEESLTAINSALNVDGNTKREPDETIEGNGVKTEIDDADDDDDSDGEEEENSGDPTTCLFCDNISPTIELAMDHLYSEHNVNLIVLRDKFNMDQYSFIKLINCIRSDNIKAEQLQNIDEPFWDDEKYLKPATYEPWLGYDYEELPPSLNCDFIKRIFEHSEGHVQNFVFKLEDKISQQRAMLEQATEDIVKMRSSYQRLIDDINDPEPNVKKLHKMRKKTKLNVDDSYFSGYAHFGIHHEMLSDEVRTTTYRDALFNNKEFIANKDVLDVGCGTGILSMFASLAGAKNVLGIDNSEIVYNAMDIIKKNNISNVTILKGLLEGTELPQEKYDIIISEWMGYFLLFECMLDTIIYARITHLKEGGTLLPNRSTMSLIGYGSEELYNNHVNFWNDVYGLDMSTMRGEVLKEPLIDIVNAEWILTESNVVADFNLNTIQMNYTNFEYNFKLKCTKDGVLSAFVGYFDTFFDLPNSISFSTSPNDKPTHWKQVVFFIDKPQALKVDDVVCGVLTCCRSTSSTRSLDITIDVFDQTHAYYLD